jgi:hypothetical protein
MAARQSADDKNTDYVPWSADVGIRTAKIGALYLCHYFHKQIS